MTTLVLGGTGATGRWLLRRLLSRDEPVRAVVRSAERVPEDVREHPDLSLIEGSLLERSDEELREDVAGCGAVASCLGHNMHLRGIWGEPRRLVTEATRRLCEAVEGTQPAAPVRYVLMNTSGNRDPDADEPRGLPERFVIGAVRTLLPPHADNEQAAEYLRSTLGPGHSMIEWVVVRPDSLIDSDEVTPYELSPSPKRSPIFDPGKTSRINVADFMADLICDDALWSRWKGRMPLIYNDDG